MSLVPSLLRVPWNKSGTMNLNTLRGLRKAFQSNLQSCKALPSLSCNRELGRGFIDFEWSPGSSQGKAAAKQKSSIYDQSGGGGGHPHPMGTQTYMDMCVHVNMPKGKFGHLHVYIHTHVQLYHAYMPMCMHPYRRTGSTQNYVYFGLSKDTCVDDMYHT